MMPFFFPSPRLSLGVAAHPYVRQCSVHADRIAAARIASRPPELPRAGIARGLTG
jgi:hypothetical protein